MFHRTERLLLRPAWPEDREMILAGIGDERVVRHLAGASSPYLPGHARDQDPRFPDFLLTRPQSQGARLVGCAGLGILPGGNAELGCWIAPPHRGRGYATEGARGVIEVAKLLGHSRLQARHYPDNPASGKVLRRLGFRPTGTVETRDCLARGEAVPCAIHILDLDAQETPARAA